MSGRGHRPCRCQRSKKIWKPPISKFHGSNQVIPWYSMVILSQNGQKKRRSWIIFLQSSRVGKEKDSNCLPVLFPCFFFSTWVICRQFPTSIIKSCSNYQGSAVNDSAAFDCFFRDAIRGSDWVPIFLCHSSVKEKNCWAENFNDC